MKANEAKNWFQPVFSNRKLCKNPVLTSLLVSISLAL